MRWSGFAVTLGLGFLFQIIHVLEGKGKDLDDCKPWQYLLKGSKNCRNCAECPAGQMFTRHCGRKQDSNGIIKFIRNKDPECELCKLGTFKTKKSKFPCKPCTRKCGKNREVIHPCNTTHDLLCSDCKKGFYMENGDCYPCQHCCGKEVMKEEFRKEFLRQKCVDDLMGPCSCRPIEGCNTLKKCYVNTTSTTSIPLIVMTSPKHLTKKAIINLSTEVNTLNPFSAKVAFRYPSSEPSANHSIGGVHIGWPIAVAVCFLFTFVALFFSFTHSNAFRKIKNSICKNVNSKHERHEPRDGEEELIVVRVGNRFEEKAQPNFTNYAQLVDSSETPQPHAVVHTDNDNLICSCHINDEDTICSTNESTGADVYLTDMGPWIYSDSPNQSTEISCSEINESSTNSLAPLDLYESDDVRQSELAIGNSSENKKRKSSRKEGEENSDEEETATSVPATTENREGNAVVIACGQHNETIRMEASKMTNGRTSDTGQKRQSERKKSKKKSKDSGNGESLKCTCGKCSYRPYVTATQLCNCTNCVPQPDDDFYKIIERHCLRAEICKELNKKDVPNWNELSIYIRIDKQIPDIKSHDNPANVVLERLKTTRPRMRLEDFSVILKKIRRQDIMDVIMRHHITCMLCRRNSFDASLQDLYMPSNFNPPTFVKSI